MSEIRGCASRAADAAPSYGWSQLALWCFGMPREDLGSRRSRYELQVLTRVTAKRWVPNRDRKANLGSIPMRTSSKVRLMRRVCSRQNGNMPDILIAAYGVDADVSCPLSPFQW